MKLTDIEKYGTLYKGSIGESGCACENSTPGLPNLEPQLKVRHAELITSVEKKVNDYPEHACSSCERLFQRKDVTSLKKNDHKFSSGMWQRVKKCISERNPDICFDTLWVCQYCRLLLNKDKMPCRCFLNGLESEPLSAELANLDTLSKQLIQRAKAFQTIVRLGTYTAKVPKYNLLKACKGTMFFLPLPLEKTLETLGEVRQPGVAGSLDSPDGENTTHLPHPELYILVNGKPSKLNVVWRSRINVDALKGAIHKLKEMNWLYKEVDEDDLDDVAREVIETVSDTSSTMLERTSKEDVAGFQSFNILTLNSKQSTS